MTKKKLLRLLALTFRDGIQVGRDGGTDPDILPEMEALEAEFEEWDPDILLQQRDEAREIAKKLFLAFFSRIASDDRSNLLRQCEWLWAPDLGVQPTGRAEEEG